MPEKKLWDLTLIFVYHFVGTFQEQILVDLLNVQIHFNRKEFLMVVKYSLTFFHVEHFTCSNSFQQRGIFDGSEKFVDMFRLFLETILFGGY